MGIEENPIGGSVKTCIIGMKRTVTGTLSITNIIIHNKNKFEGVIANTKISNRSIIPAFSNEKTSIKRLIKKNTNLKSTLVK